MSSLPPDPYKILGVSEDAQLAEIRSAHRKLVLKCHPDKIQDPTLKAQKQDEFQKVQQAYELLTDENERQRYDDQVRQRARVAELRKQMQAKANSSSPRATATFKYEIRTAERPSTFKSGSAESPPSGKVYTGFSRSYDEDVGRSPRFEPEIRTVRREQSYTDKSSKREAEKERERDRDRALERERLREREKNERRREETLRRAEKEAKDARRADKKAREKEREKDRKAQTEEKKRHTSPYIESYEDEIPDPVVKAEKKKKSSNKKHDEKRERSTHREEVPPPTSALHPPPIPQDRISSNLDYAASYIEASRQKTSNGHRTAAQFHTRHIQPPAPTPPPAPGQSSPFAVPDEDEPRRSSAQPRRGSSGEKAYKKPSREALGEPDIVDVSPRHPPSFQKSSTAIPISSSPPRHNLPRTYTTPIDPGYSRPIAISRSQTFTGAYEISDPRGRARSKLQAQVEEDSDFEDDYESRHRDRKHRSSKKQRSPERPAGSEYVQTYSINGGRAKPSKSGTYRHPDDVDLYGYYSSRHATESTRPSMPIREGSYSGAPAGLKFQKVKTAKAYGYEDVSYSPYQPQYRDDYASAFA